MNVKYRLYIYTTRAHGLAFVAQSVRAFGLKIHRSLVQFPGGGLQAVV